MLSLFSGAFFASLLITAFFLFAASYFKVYQTEREEGPESHKIKSGIPTMGGIGLTISVAIISLAALGIRILPIIFLFVGFSIIGLSDDLIKVFKKRNLGLTFWQKIILQTAVASIFALYILGVWPIISSVFYFLFLVFLIVGTANATNLTDGLDGLLAGCGIFSFASFFIVALHHGFKTEMVFCVIFVGALLGFLFFNFPKAAIFMGDTGSLAIGAALAGVAITIHHELALMIFGFVFMIEALSVIIQVVSYKIYKKRVFKMAPLHHHFELLGFSERAIVAGFWLVQFVSGLIGMVLL